MGYITCTRSCRFTPLLVHSPVDANASVPRQESFDCCSTGHPTLPHVQLHAPYRLRGVSLHRTWRRTFAYVQSTVHHPVGGRGAKCVLNLQLNPPETVTKVPKPNRWPTSAWVDVTTWPNRHAGAPSVLQHLTNYVQGSCCLTCYPQFHTHILSTSTVPIPQY